MSWLFGSKSQKESVRPSDDGSSVTAPASVRKPSSSDEEQLLFIRYGIQSPAPSTTTQTTPTVTVQPLPETETPTEKLEPITPYPETMSCQAAFDAAFRCQSIGGQFNNIWRYGELRDCKHHWSQWSFCMGLKVHTEPVRRQMVRDWYKKLDDDKYGPEEMRGKKFTEGQILGEDGNIDIEKMLEERKPSSQDVWDERKTKVKRAFDQDPSAGGVFEKRMRG